MQLALIFVGLTLFLSTALTIVSTAALKWNRSSYFLPEPYPVPEVEFNMEIGLFKTCTRQAGKEWVCEQGVKLHCDADWSVASCAQFRISQICAVVACLAILLSCVGWHLPGLPCCNYTAYHIKERIRRLALGLAVAACACSAVATFSFLAWEHTYASDVEARNPGGWFTNNGDDVGWYLQLWAFSIELVLLLGSAVYYKCQGGTPVWRSGGEPRVNHGRLRLLASAMLNSEAGAVVAVAPHAQRGGVNMVGVVTVQGRM